MDSKYFVTVSTLHSNVIDIYEYANLDLLQTELKIICACHGLAWRNWEIQGLFVIVLRLNYYFTANFRQVFKYETVVLKRYFVPLLQDGLLSESSKLSCSTYILA